MPSKWPDVLLTDSTGNEMYTLIDVGVVGSMITKHPYPLRCL